MRPLQALLTICLGLLVFFLASRSAGESIPATFTAIPVLESTDGEPAPGMFLVARRELHGPFFAQSVVLLVEHDANGSLGLIVNRRSRLSLSDTVPGIQNTEADKHPVFLGGPLGMHQLFMLMRHSDSLPHTRHIVQDIYFSADRRVLDGLLTRKTPDSELHLYLGYAGWAAGQLAMELAHGSWFLVKGDPETIFETPSRELWETLIDKLEPRGIEVRRDPAGAA